MREIRVVERIEQIDRFIQSGKAGKAMDLAKKLGVSKRCVFTMLKIMKEDFKAPVVFDNKLKTYRYTREGSIVAAFVKKEKA